jgi:hypothetical protein
MLLLGPHQLHAPEASQYGTSYSRTMMSVETCARHEKQQSTGGQESRCVVLSVVKVHLSSMAGLRRVLDVCCIANVLPFNPHN